jgi:membrane protein required for colicin V production
MTKSLVNSDWMAGLIAYSAVFLAVFIPFAFMSHRFSQSVKNSPIGPLDRAAGLAFGVVRGLVIVGLAYLAFTYFVPIRQHPRWITEAKLLPIVQDTADVLLSVVPDRPHDFAYVPQHEEIRQAPPQSEPNGQARNQPAVAPVKPDIRHDPMAELIRKAERAPKSAPIAPPVQQKSAAASQKSYGASDRQALDKLVQTGGNR